MAQRRRRLVGGGAGAAGLQPRRHCWLGAAPAGTGEADRRRRCEVRCCSVPRQGASNGNGDLSWVGLLDFVRCTSRHVVQHLPAGRAQAGGQEKLR
ncbi:unnamed protein product [Urochloa humidicola]